MNSLPRALDAMAAQKGHNEFGDLPVWNLADLYPGNDSARGPRRRRSRRTIRASSTGSRGKAGW
jgi:oligoendopeptidase F